MYFAFFFSRKYKSSAKHSYELYRVLGRGSRKLLNEHLQLVAALDYLGWGPVGWQQLFMAAAVVHWMYEFNKILGYRN